MPRCRWVTAILLGILGLMGTINISTARAQPARDRQGRRQNAAADQNRQQPPAEAPLRVETPPPLEPLRTAGDRPVNIEHIRLDLKVDLPKKTVEALAALKVKSMRALSSVTLDAVDFEVKKVAVGNGGSADVPAKFSHHDGKLTINLEPSWPAGKEATLRIEYRVREPKAGLHFFGPTEAEPEIPLTVWSQGESITNRYWIPCLDHPNQRQTTEVVVTVPQGFEALSNGSLVDRSENPSDKTVTFHWLQDKPHPSYLVTLAVGQYDIVKTEWDKLPVLYYVPKGHKDEVANTFSNTPEMLDFFSKRFGIRYPWDKYAQVVVEQFTAGGMENTSATTLTEFCLHDKRSLLDGNSDSLISHELAHQWWGDLVTCRDWSHIWLNEGFASYMEAVWDEHKNGSDEYAFNMFNKGRAAIGGGRTRPIIDRRYPNPDSMFDARAYPKGAFVLHMLRQRLGDDTFWKGIQHYGTTNRLQSVETGDFRKAMEQVSGHDLDRFFYDWTERPGCPALEVTTEYLSESKQARVTVKQTQQAEAYHFPLKLVLHGSKDHTIDREITQKEVEILIPMDQPLTGIDVDPKEAVLAELKENKSREMWKTQLASPSVVCRIRAIEHFRESKSPEDKEILANAMKAEKFRGLQQEIARALGDAGGNVCRNALLEALKNSDARVRRACVESLGRFAKDEQVATALKELINKGDESYGVEAGALDAYARLDQKDAVAVLMPWLDKPSHREVIRTAALSGLGASKDASAFETLISWTQKGKPRTCRASALRALGQFSRSDALSDDQKKKIVNTVSGCLEKEGRMVQMASIGTLQQMGKAAASALPALESLEKADGDGRIRNMVRGAIDQIRNSPESASEELKRVREELDSLRKNQKALEERLKKIEKPATPENQSKGQN